MKKIYSKPEMGVEEILPLSMIAESLKMSSDHKANKDGDVLSRQSWSWDDEED